MNPVSVQERESISANDNKDIISSVISYFKYYFLKDRFKLKTTVDVITAYHKKSFVELWLPKLTYPGNCQMFRLSLDLKTTQEFLIILNRTNDNDYYFKLVNQRKRSSQDNSDYPVFNNFEDLLHTAVQESSHQNSYVENEKYLPVYEEESITILKTSTEF